MDKIKIIGYDEWNFRCKIYYNEFEIRAIFQKRQKCFFGLFKGYEDIPYRSYAFTISPENKPTDGRPTAPPDRVSVYGLFYYKTWNVETLYADSNLIARLHAIANDIIEDTEKHNKVFRTIKEKFKSI